MEGMISPNTQCVPSGALFSSLPSLSILAAYLISGSFQKHSLPVSLPPFLLSLLLPTPARSPIVPTVPEVALHLFVETEFYPFSLLSPTKVIWGPSGAKEGAPWWASGAVVIPDVLSLSQ